MLNICLISPHLNVFEPITKHDIICRDNIPVCTIPSTIRQHHIVFKNDIGGFFSKPYDMSKRFPKLSGILNTLEHCEDINKITTLNKRRFINVNTLERFFNDNCISKQLLILIILYVVDSIIKLGIKLSTISFNIKRTRNGMINFNLTIIANKSAIAR